MDGVAKRIIHKYLRNLEGMNTAENMKQNISK